MTWQKCQRHPRGTAQGTLSVRLGRKGKRSGPPFALCDSPPPSADGALCKLRGLPGDCAHCPSWRLWLPPPKGGTVLGCHRCPVPKLWQSAELWKSRGPLRGQTCRLLPGSDTDGDPDPPGRRGAGAPPRPPQAPALWGTSQEPRPAGLAPGPGSRCRCRCLQENAQPTAVSPPREQQRWRSLRAGLGGGAGRLSPHSLPADGASRRPCPTQLLLRALSPRASPLFYKGQVPQGTRPSAQNWVLGQASTLL